MDPRIRKIEQGYVRSDLPAFAPGDTVRVRVRVTEGAKERVQAFEGVCIARAGAGLSETFTVRKTTGGVGVERIFPIHSPSIAGLEVVRRGHVRRAKLYYLRARRGKRARVKERRWWLDPKATRVAVSAAQPPPQAPAPDTEAASKPDVPAAAEPAAAEAAAAESESAAAPAPAGSGEGA